MDEGARFREAAIERMEQPVAMPRDISSRSARVNADLERLRSGGRIPPVSARMPSID